MRRLADANCYSMECAEGNCKACAGNSRTGMGCEHFCHNESPAPFEPMNEKSGEGMKNYSEEGGIGPISSAVDLNIGSTVIVTDTKGRNKYMVKILDMDPEGDIQVKILRGEYEGAVFTVIRNQIIKVVSADNKELKKKYKPYPSTYYEEDPGGEPISNTPPAGGGVSAMKKRSDWQDYLQNVYSSFEEFLAYDEIYGQSEILGYDSPEEAWEANPFVGGSVNPSDYGKRTPPKKRHAGNQVNAWTPLPDEKTKVMRKTTTETGHIKPTAEDVAEGIAFFFPDDSDLGVWVSFQDLEPLTDDLKDTLKVTKDEQAQDTDLIKNTNEEKKMDSEAGQPVHKLEKKESLTKKANAESIVQSMHDAIAGGYGKVPYSKREGNWLYTLDANHNDNESVGASLQKRETDDRQWKEDFNEQVPAIAETFVNGNISDARKMLMSVDPSQTTERKHKVYEYLKENFGEEEADSFRRLIYTSLQKQSVLVDQIIAYEQGDLDDESTIKLFSELVKSGQAWTLQGHYGRVAKSLIDAGYLDENGKILGAEEDMERLEAGKTRPFDSQYFTQKQLVNDARKGVPEQEGLENLRESLQKQAKSPPGWKHTVEKMKKHKEITNPWALAWSEKEKGYTPGGKKSSLDGADFALNPEIVAGEVWTKYNSVQHNPTFSSLEVFIKREYPKLTEFINEIYDLKS